jgi:uncharacterized protein DUF1501
MLRILGSANPFGRDCNRREVMRIGALGAATLSLPELLLLESTAASQGLGATKPPFGRAKRIMLLYLQGAASQFETWDPKPDAPEEVRGKWGAISTSVPGVAICDQLPKMAQLVDRLAIVRSMTHENNNSIRRIGNSMKHSPAGASTALVRWRTR